MKIVKIEMDMEPPIYFLDCEDTPENLNKFKKAIIKVQSRDEWLWDCDEMLEALITELGFKVTAPLRFDKDMDILDYYELEEEIENVKIDDLFCTECQVYWDSRFNGTCDNCGGELIPARFANRKG